MKKIAIIFPKDSEAMFNKQSTKTFGGASVQMYLLAKELLHHDNLITYSFILDYDKINFVDSEDFNLIKTYKNEDNLITKLLKFKKQIDKIKPDVIIQQGLSPLSPLLAKYCNLNKIKFIFTFASDVESRGEYQGSRKKCRLFKMLLDSSFLLITQNNYQRNNLLQIYNKKSKIIYPSMVIPKIKEVKNKKRSDVLWVSRCERLKKAEIFIKLANNNPSLKFVMICPPSNDLTYYKDVNAIAKKSKNIKFIRFASFQKIDSYFKDAKVFVNTSEYEGFPNTFIQSVKFGIPIISLNVNPDKFITKYNCGYVCHNDYLRLNKNLQILLGNKKKYALLSSNAFVYAKNKHNLIKNTKLLLSKINLNEK